MQRKLRPQVPDPDREVLFVHEQEVVLPDSKDRYVVEFEVTTKVPAKGDDSEKVYSDEPSFCHECCFEAVPDEAATGTGLRQSIKLPEKSE